MKTVVIIGNSPSRSTPGANVWPGEVLQLLLEVAAHPATLYACARQKNQACICKRPSAATARAYDCYHCCCCCFWRAARICCTRELLVHIAHVSAPTAHAFLGCCSGCGAAFASCPPRLARFCESSPSAFGRARFGFGVSLGSGSALRSCFGVVGPSTDGTVAGGAFAPSACSTLGAEALTPAVAPSPPRRGAFPDGAATDCFSQAARRSQACRCRRASRKAMRQLLQVRMLNHFSCFFSWAAQRTAIQPAPSLFSAPARTSSHIRRPFGTCSPCRTPGRSGSGCWSGEGSPAKLGIKSSYASMSTLPSTSSLTPSSVSRSSSGSVGKKQRRSACASPEESAVSGRDATAFADPLPVRRGAVFLAGIVK
mmetsp:Transcript_72078/g.199969  ORF Transcript_72078/g.199969 Transcript_72078/m.199969 type:complete len:369 (-) Transcript_72078:101-1207(-)